MCFLTLRTEGVHFQERRKDVKNIKRIMVAIDLSDYSKETLEYAADLAADLKTDLVIVNSSTREIFTPMSG